MSGDKNSKEPVAAEGYPNSPLVEVVCEIRFPGDLAVDCRKHEFHRAIRDAYSKILAPNVEAGQPVATKPYRFESPETAAGVMLAVDRFAYYETNYGSHKTFIPEFLRLAGVLSDIFHIDKLNRVGWRYINVIPFTREDGILPIRRFLRLGVDVPEGVSTHFENVKMLLLSRVPGGTITTKLESLMRPEDNQEAFLLDFDFGMTDSLRFSAIRDYVKHAHDNTRDLFERLITDEYREYLKGESI